MIPVDIAKNYLDLLKIRQSARIRDARIMGYVCLVSFLATIGFGLLQGLEGREVYLVLPMDLVLLFIYLMAWTRLEVTNAAIEMVENLKA